MGVGYTRVTNVSTTGVNKTTIVSLRLEHNPHNKGSVKLDTKDKTIYFLVLLVMFQFLLNTMFVTWYYEEVSVIEGKAEFAKELAMDSYNSNIYAQNYNVELERDIWDMQDYLNRTSGYVPYKPLYYGEIKE